MIKNMEKTRETEVKETSVTLAENNDKTGDEEVIKVSAVKETEDISSGFDMFMEGRSGNAALTLDLQEAGSISYYREKMEKKEKIEIMFSVIDRYDNLFAYAGEVTVKMLNKYIRGYRSRIYNRAICLSRPYPVEVTAVDEENMTVYVSHVAVKEIPRKQAVERITSLLGQGKNVRVKAAITDVFDNTDSGKVRQIVYVDICGLGILGRIPIKEWANAYTPNLKRDAVVGSIVDVIITGMSQYVRLDNGNVKITKENEEIYRDMPKRIVFNCSRREYHRLIGYDPWELALKKLSVGMTVRFTVVDSSKTKRSFFAEIDGIPNFNAIGSFLDGVDYVPVGAEYSGFVSKIKSETKYLRVRCLEKIERVDTKKWKELDKGVV